MMGRSSNLPMLKLRCLIDGFNVEELSLRLQNLGLPEDFSRHMLKQHQLANPKEDIDYVTEQLMET